MKLKILLTSLLVLNIAFLNAGTIIYKTSKDSEKNTLAKVKIISISKGTITIKQGKGIRTIPLGYLSSYYDTDIDAGSFADNTCDYTVSISEIKNPKTGYIYTKIKKSKKKSQKVSDFEIEFSVNKKIEKGKSKSIRMPYFYLYVLTTNTKSYGKRPVFSFYYPEEAKVKSKTYDEAQIIEAINSMERPHIYHGEKSSFTGKIGKLTTANGYRPAVISMKGIKNQKIIAYHLEVWGKDKMVFEKDWSDSINHSVGKNWWKIY